MSKPFPQEEYFRLSQDLEKFHEIFATLWKISTPRFTKEVPTAAVAFNKQGGCIDFMINEDFWNSRDQYTQEFIICHEMCHVLLSHGTRMMPYTDKFTPDTLNVALDLAVNHLLTAFYNFDRFAINDWKELCWADTVLKDLQLPPNKSFEYYIQQIEPHCQQISVQVASHDYLKQFDGTVTDAIKNAANEVNKTLDKDKMRHVQQEVKDFKEGKGRSDNESDLFIRFTGDNIKYRRIKKWEDVIKKAVTIADKERESTQWIRSNRRVAFFNSDLLLPSDNLITDREAYKYKVWLFMDYSGSCSSLKQPFFRASNTFDPKKFEVKKFAHDTKVQEFKNNECTLSGYSTSFSCIERFIQEKVSGGMKYPDFVFHYTDGYGDDPRAQFPERWHIFLSKRHSRYCFENGKYNIFELKDFILETI
mgnify:CR=1 FL=1